jgi:hypothetical protein
MKILGCSLLLIVPLSFTCFAGPLQKEQIAADAKWLVHLDVDKLRATTSGDYIIKQLLNPKLNDFTRQFDFDLDWNKVNSLTAYGSAFQSKSSFNGVVLIKTDLDLRKALDSAIEKMTQDKGKEGNPIQKSEEGNITTYSLKDSVFAAFQPGKPVILGRSLDSVQKAGEVFSKDSPNLTSAKTFAEFPKTEKPFFFQAAIDGFNPEAILGGHPQEGDEANPKAKILKMADGARIMLGEELNQLFADISLKAKSSEVVTQIQQVVQGMIALASLSQQDNQNLQQLTQSAKVSSAGKIVSLSLSYPADQAITLLSSNLNKHLDRPGHAQNRANRRAKHKEKDKDQPTPEAPTKTDDQ